jgi:hypothetical protein
MYRVEQAPGQRSRGYDVSTTIDRSQPIAVTLTLTAEHWEMVARVLSNGPYGVVAPLIGQIQQQCMRYAEVPAEHMRTRLNGEERPDA